MAILAPVQEKFHGTTSVSITVRDIHKSIAWYRDVVGFGIERTVEREGTLIIAYMKAGNVRIGLNQDDGAKGWERIKGLGCSINIWTNDDVDTIANRIKSNGGKLVADPVDAPWGARFFSVIDPDGFKLSLLKALSPPK